MLSGIKHVVSCTGQETEFDSIDDAMKFATDVCGNKMQPAYVLSPVATLTPTVNVTVVRQDKEVPTAAILQNTNSTPVPVPPA